MIEMVVLHTSSRPFLQLMHFRLDCGRQTSFPNRSDFSSYADRKLMTPGMIRRTKPKLQLALGVCTSNAMNRACNYLFFQSFTSGAGAAIPKLLYFGFRN